MKKIVFALIGLAMSSLVACDSDDNPTPEIEPTCESTIEAFNQSLEFWETRKAEFNNSYSFTIIFGDQIADRGEFLTRITVKNGEITERFFENTVSKTNTDTGEIEKEVVETYTESGDEIGTNKGFEPLTLDGVYTACGERLEFDECSFEANTTTQLISSCSILSIKDGCDYCFGVPTVVEIKAL